jgi:hypothetical protein
MVYLIAGMTLQPLTVPKLHLTAHRQVMATPESPAARAA